MAVVAASAAHAATPAPAPEAEAAMARARAVAAYPTFADVPPLPKDVRGFGAWTTAIATIKTQGADVAHLAAIEPWTLHDSEAWASDERGRAAAPAQITQASTTADTEAYAAALRARATPPPRKR